MNNLAKSRFWLGAAALACVAFAAPALADDGGLDSRLDRLLNSHETTTYKRLTTIQIPQNKDANPTGAPFAVFDISFVDRVLPLYYLADRTNASLDVVDTRNNKVVAQIGGFVGVRKDPATNAVSTAVSGPDGVQPVGVGEVWVGDGDSTVKVVDLKQMKVVETISTALDSAPGAADRDKRADEMTLDPRDNILVVANNAAVPPFVTFISTDPTNRRVLGHLIYKDADGVEASIYDPKTGYFYINLTQVLTQDRTVDPNNGAVSVVDPRTMQEVTRFPVTGCNGAGIDLAPGQKLLIGCSLTNNSQIISARDGKLLATIPQVSGSDQVWFNRGDGKFYLAARNNPKAAGGPVLGVVDAVTNKWITNIPTDASAHSVAADARTNHIYVPLGPISTDPNCTNGCIAVYAGHEHEGRTEREVEAFLSGLERN